MNSHGEQAFFTYFWNMCDLLNYIFFLVTFYFKVRVRTKLNLSKMGSHLMMWMHDQAHLTSRLIQLKHTASRAFIPLQRLSFTMMDHHRS